MNQYLSKNKFTITFIIFLVISVLSMFFTTSSFILTPKIILGAISYPFIMAYNFVFENIIQFFNSLNELKRLKDENALLKSQLTELKDIQFKLVQLELENKELKKLLELQNFENFKIITAKIILKDPSNLYSVIVIDKGINKGIKRGNPVYTIIDGEKLVVGRVIETSYSYSKIMTIFDSRSLISVKEMYTNFSGIARGNAPESNLLEVQYFPNEAEIYFNDLFLTSGYGGIYPPGLIIGNVVDIQKKIFSIYQNVKLKPKLNLSKVSYVFVILDYFFIDLISQNREN